MTARFSIRYPLSSNSSPTHSWQTILRGLRQAWERGEPTISETIYIQPFQNPGVMA